MITCIGVIGKLHLQVPSVFGVYTNSHTLWTEDDTDGKTSHRKMTCNTKFLIQQWTSLSSKENWIETSNRRGVKKS